MNTDQCTGPSRVLSVLSLLACVCSPAVLSGCGSAPSQANIELRKQNQQLQQQITTLQTRNDALAAQVLGLQSNWPTTQILPQSRLDQLFTTHGLAFASGTGFTNLTGKPVLDVYVFPTDDDGQPLKAAGSFTIELFDLNLKTHNLLESWHFPLEEARQDWLGEVFLYTYAFTCPLQKPPAHDSLLLRVTFVDALTERRFTAEKDLQYNLAWNASISPSTLPASRP